jgi:hypothetical protein
MPEELDPIEQAALEPQRASGDGQSVDNRSLKDLIEADKYLANKRARSGMGMKITQLVPPGGTGV